MGKKTPRTRKSRIDWRLARFLAANLSIGAVAGCSFVAAALYLDLGGLGALIGSSSDKVMAVVILCVAMTVTWGSASMGTAIFLLPKRKDERTGGGKIAPAPQLAPAPALGRMIPPSKA